MCIFCKIIKGEIPSKKIYEDDDVLAILDISQATKGHTLVMPKKHYANILEIEEKDYLKVMAKVRELTKTITTAFDASGCNILNNCKEVAGQSVDHFHVHILPRYNSEELTIKFTEHQLDLDEIEKTIKNK